MKTVYAALVALTAATPVLAGSGTDQLAKSLGVEPGQYTLEQLVALKSVQGESGNAARVNLNNLRDYGVSFVNEVARAHYNASLDE